MSVLKHYTFKNKCITAQCLRGNYKVLSLITGSKKKKCNTLAIPVTVYFCTLQGGIIGGLIDFITYKFNSKITNGFESTAGQKWNCYYPRLAKVTMSTMTHDMVLNAPDVQSRTRACSYMPTKGTTTARQNSKHISFS